MSNRNNDKGGNKDLFTNAPQRKFYLITKGFKIGNIVGTVVLVLFIGKSLLGI
jgi:hypothetical protein